jgi:S1-C subfamily serine protease
MEKKNFHRIVWINIIAVFFVGLKVSSSDLYKPLIRFKQFSIDLTQQNLERVEPKNQITKLRLQAELITVKILAENSWGSGILIKKQGQEYFVVTNEHVLRDEADGYKIQTLDGIVHRAYRLNKVSFIKYDLALLKFKSDRTEYAVAKFGNSSIVRERDTVIAAGFPFNGDRSDDRGFKFTTGIVSLIAPKSLEDGYQIGYTNQIEKGMSGGPVLNLRGEVVAINGMHAYPLWGDPYVYQDGEKPSRSLHDIMVRSSWGIPINTFLQLAPDLIGQKK